jgi:hypothetical protein
VLKSKSGFQPLGFDSAPNSILRQAREATQYPYFFSRFALNFAQRAFWGAAIFREPWPKEYGATRLRTSRPPIYPARREPRPRGEGYLLDVLFPLSIPRQYFPNPLSLGMNELYRILRHRYYSSPEETLTQIAHSCHSHPSGGRLCSCGTVSRGRNLFERFVPRLKPGLGRFVLGR